MLKVTYIFYCNREDVPISPLEQLAIVEEETQTDSPLKSEVQTETEKLQFDEEKLQYDDGLISRMRERKTMFSTTNNLPMLKTCSRHCDELRSRISQDEGCECLVDAAVRVNADVVFTAKPKQVVVEGQVQAPDYNYSRTFRPVETWIVSQTSTMATSPTGSLNKDKKCIDLVQDFKTGLRSLVMHAPQHDSACSPIHNLDEYGNRFRSLEETFAGTPPIEMFSWQQDRSTLESSSNIALPPFATQVLSPPLKASCGTLMLLKDCTIRIIDSSNVNIKHSHKGYIV